MVKLTILLTLGFRNAYEKAANWLRKTSWNSLFLELPIELEPFLKAYVEEKNSEKEFWSNCILLTGLSEPFIHSLKLRFQPVLDCLKDTYTGERELYCYQDMNSYIKENKILEKILLLEFRYRLIGKLSLREWKNTLFQEMKTREDSWRIAVERLREETEKNPHNIILHGGYLEFINRLKTPGKKVEIILMEEYWKSPLDILRTILWKHRFFNISDDKIEYFLKLQKNYLDLIINSKDVDQAHLVWTQMIHK